MSIRGNKSIAHPQNSESSPGDVPAPETDACLEYRNGFDDPEWKPLHHVAAGQDMADDPDPESVHPVRIYRVRVIRRTGE